ncbi:MAG: hypothetical protein AB7H97_03245, partial [Pseudobdellovibrionaceae bacterium]
YMRISVENMPLPETLIEYVEVLQQLDRWDDILKMTQKALERTAEFEALYQKRILAFNKLGRKKEAEEFINNVREYTNKKGWQIAG